MIKKSNERFSKVAQKIAYLMGSSWAFLIALLLVIVWLCSGPIFQFSTNWQLLINTGTTISTFLMVFLIQNSQNRQDLAMQLKLDELIKSIQGARNHLINLENLSEDELKELQKQFQEIQNK